MFLFIVAVLIGGALWFGLAALGAVALQFILHLFNVDLSFWTSFGALAAVLLLLVIIRGALK